jgi:hypothetical protein
MNEERMEDTTPMTEAVMEASPMAFNEHEWIQMGYSIYDHCQPRGAFCQEQAVPIPSQTVLIKKGDGYSLRPEYTGPR